MTDRRTEPATSRGLAGMAGAAAALGATEMTMSGSAGAAAADRGAPVRPPAWSLRGLLWLDRREASFAVRGFAAGSDASRPALEAVGTAFIDGYNVALGADRIDDVLRHIERVSPSHRGFAAEGAAMGTAILDALPFRAARLPAYLAAVAPEFTYLAHVGAGFALARVPWRRRHILAPLDSIHGWLAFDGLGFHDCYFHHRRVGAGWQRLRTGYAVRAYDQGVGRGLWFVAGGDAGHAAGLIEALPPARRADLWSGLGLAMAYAGPADDDDLAQALARAGDCSDHFAQGAAFGCEARVRAGHVPVHTDAAAQLLWNTSATALAGLVRGVRGTLPAADAALPRYETWRRGIAVLHRQRSRGHS